MGVLSVEKEQLWRHVRPRFEVEVERGTSQTYRLLCPGCFRIWAAPVEVIDHGSCDEVSRYEFDSPSQHIHQNRKCSHHWWAVWRHDNLPTKSHLCRACAHRSSTLDSSMHRQSPLQATTGSNNLQIIPRGVWAILLSVHLTVDPGRSVSVTSWTFPSLRGWFVTTLNTKALLADRTVMVRVPLWKQDETLKNSEINIPRMLRIWQPEVRCKTFHHSSQNTRSTHSVLSLQNSTLIAHKRTS